MSIIQRIEKKDGKNFSRCYIGVCCGLHHTDGELWLLVSERRWPMDFFGLVHNEEGGEEWLRSK